MFIFVVKALQSVIEQPEGRTDKLKWAKTFSGPQEFSLLKWNEQGMSHRAQTGKC